MKKILFIALLIGILAIIIAGSITTKVSYTKAEQVEKSNPELTRAQEAWLGALIWCESKGNAQAINPKDRDNTPSYGLLQFKPSTFELFKKQYGVTGKLMDPEVQEEIVKEMIIHGRKDWTKQFPDCVRKLGKPPVVIHSKSVDKN